MDFDDQSETTRPFNTLSMTMGHTMTAPLNNTVDFLVITLSLIKQNLSFFFFLV
jgi:hypothetical protein